MATIIPPHRQPTIARATTASLSLHLDLRGLDHAVPAIDLLTHVVARSRNGAAENLGRQLLQTIFYLGLAQRLVGIGVDLVDDGLGRVRRGDDGVPRDGFEAWERLGDRWYGRERRQSRRRGHGD